jgi:nucleotidyltransferase/DNA polymerase involved in DNA repair
MATKTVRFACLLVEHLPLCVEALREPEVTTGCRVVLRAWDRRVLDVTPDVIAAGVEVGDSWHRVEQLCPQAQILPAEEATYRAYHDRLAEILAGFVGDVENGALGELFGEASAIARTFPSEKAFALHLAAAAQRASGLPARVGIAANKFTALQAAHQATTQPGHALVVPAGDEARFLAPLPLSALPDAPIEMVRRLFLLDITTLGGLAQLPYAAVIRQFGMEAAEFHRLARGIDARPLTPQAPPPLVMQRMVLPEPLVERQGVLTALEHLAGRVSRTLERQGHHAQAISLVAVTVNGHSHTEGIPVKPPSADATLLRRLAGRLLGRMEFAAPISELRLTAYPLREWHIGARQLVLFEAEATSPRLGRLHAVLRQLRQRFGATVIGLACLVGPPLPLPIQVETGAGETPARLCWGGWSRWVVSIYESWREQCRWWDQPIARDYYHVETDAGAAFTVFRDGDGRWFLDRRRG